MQRWQHDHIILNFHNIHNIYQIADMNPEKVIRFKDFIGILHILTFTEFPAPCMIYKQLSLINIADFQWHLYIVIREQILILIAEKLLHMRKNSLHL